MDGYSRILSYPLENVNSSPGIAAKSTPMNGIKMTCGPVGSANPNLIRVKAELISKNLIRQQYRWLLVPMRFAFFPLNNRM